MYAHPYIKSQTIQALIVFGSIGIGALVIMFGFNTKSIGEAFGNIIFGLILVGIGYLIIKSKRNAKATAIQSIFEKTNQSPLYITESFLVDDDEKGHIAILNDQFVFFTKNKGYSFPFHELQDFRMISQDSGNSVSTVSESMFDNDKVFVKTSSVMLETFAILGEKDGSEYINALSLWKRVSFGSALIQLD